MAYRPACLVLLLALAGCNTQMDPMLTAATNRTATPASGAVAPEYALATLPAFGPQVTAVRQASTADGIEQHIVLANGTRLPGENMLTIEIGKARDPRFRVAPKRAVIATEMQAALSGIGMTISEAAGTNTYGPFGYASGRGADGTTCIYAWQIIPHVSGNAQSAGPAYAAQIRLRYCAVAGAGRDLSYLMEGLRLKPVSRDTVAALRTAVEPGFRVNPRWQAIEPNTALPSRRTTPPRPATSEPLQASAVPAPLPSSVSDPSRSVANAATIPIPD